MVSVVLYQGDMREVLRGICAESVDSVVTDPPYHLTSIVKRFGAENAAPAQYGKDGAFARASKGFMGKKWDGGDVAFDPATWAEVWRVLKPGGHLVAMGGTRTYHRLVCAIEDAGFEVRDTLMWLYGSGFPKSHDVSKAIDKAAGHWRGKAGNIIERTIGQVAKGTEYLRTDKGKAITEEASQWEGWGTALKPAVEPIVLARKPLSETTVAANVLRWRVGALNVDGCRVGIDHSPRVGRWPANVLHDGSEEVIETFPQTRSGVQKKPFGTGGIWSGISNDPCGPQYGDSGSAARFFYSAKASKYDRAGSKHPTVKPVALMRWLVRLVTPPGGLVLDPFAGSGTTGQAAREEGMGALLIEREGEYIEDIKRRLGIEVAEYGEKAEGVGATSWVRTRGEAPGEGA